MATGLKFYPASHRYKLDGAWVQGVTTIIGHAKPKPALPKWSAKAVAQYVVDNPDQVERLRQMGAGPMLAALKEIPWQERDDASNRGTEVHTFAERIANGDEVDVPESLVGHVESCIAFLDDWQIQPVLVEVAVASREHGYAGTLDLVADHDKGPRGIFDYKTSRSGIYAETAFQLAAYAFAEFHGLDGDEHPMADLGIEASYGVHIRADGYDVYPLEFGNHVFDEFLLMAQAARLYKRCDGDWRTPGSGYVGLAVQSWEETA